VIDTYILAAALAIALGCALLTRFTEPGGLFRAPIVVLAVRTAHGLAYHHAGGRHVRRPDPLATIPDALKARTA
jgi:hypothetical protein